MDISESICYKFEPQKWRETKCKNCFEDVKRHKLKSQNENEIQAVLNSDKDQEQSNGQSTNDSHDIQNVSNRNTSNQEIISVSEKLIYKNLEDDSEMKNYDAPSFEATGKLSYENGGNSLTKYSTVEFSSCSSLASYDALEDTTLSSYSYSGSRDNLDGFISGEEVSFGDNALENNASAETTEQMVIVLEEEIENLRENKKTIEMNKDKQIQALDRELQDLKLELAKYSARENMSILKKRLEIEGKNIRIEELENEVRHFQSTVDNLNQSLFGDEFQHDILMDDLKRRNKKIHNLEDEKKTLEERLSLAEDLQQNDRELLDVLRNQLTSLEKDLLSSEDRNKSLEERLKSLHFVEDDLREERLNLQKLNKQIDFLTGKLRLREQHVSYLEDDNVSLNQQNQELESKLKKSLTKADRLKNTIKDLENDIDVYNKEIERLNVENNELERGHWQAIIEQTDASGEVQNYIQDLEKRVNESELKIRDLEFENEAVLKESGELLDNLVDVRADYEEIKNKFESVTEKYDHTLQLKNDQDKRTILLQRKVKKLQKEKKRCQTEKTDAESKISELRNSKLKLSVKCDEIEKGYKMIQLKLQSTEAKLTMLEGNKVYLEAKIDEYEKKYKKSQSKLIAFNNLVNKYDCSGSKEDVPKQEELNLDVLELKLKSILDNDYKNNSKVEEFEENKTDNRLIGYDRRVDDNEKLYLESREESQKIMSAREKEQFNDIFDYFETNLTQLKEQNEILESELCEVLELKTSLESVNDGTKGASVTDAAYCSTNTNICSLSAPLLSCSNGTVVEQDVTLCTGNAGSEPNEVDQNDDVKLLYHNFASFPEKSSIDGIKVFKRCNEDINETLPDLDPNFKEETCCYHLEQVTDFVLDRKGNAGVEVEEVVTSRSDGSPQIRKLLDGDILSNSYDETDLPNKSDIDDLVSQGPENLMPFENASFSRTVDSYAENLVRGIFLDVALSCGIDKRKINTTEVKNETINRKVEFTDEEYTSIQDDIMESARPVTSVRCVFETLPIEAGSASSCAQDAKLIGLGKSNYHHKTATFPLTKPRSTNYSDKQPVRVADKDCLIEKNGERIRANTATPYYTVAVSQIGQPNEYLEEKNEAPKESTMIAETSNSFRLTQESSGEVTLTIPSSCLDDSDVDSDIEQDQNSKVEETQPLLIPAVTVPLKKPDCSDKKTEAYTRTEKSYQDENSS